MIQEDKFHIKVEKIVYGGKGLGRLNNKAVFIPFVLPDEDVIIKPYKEKKNIIYAYSVKLLKENKNRISPYCEHYGVCGGCDFQHANYSYQILLKKQILEENLIRIGKIKNLPEIKLVPSKKDFFYRNRVQLKIYGENIGFYKKESHEVVDIKTCPLIVETVRDYPLKLRKLLSFFKVQPVQIHIFFSKSGNLIKFFFPKKIKEHPDLKTIRSVLDENIAGVGIYVDDKKDVKLQKVLGKPYTFKSIKDFVFRVSLDSFFQVNDYQVDTLVDIVLDNIQDSKTVADMYCGVGTFSIPVSKKVKRVYGFEINKIAVKDAVENLALNKVKNIDFHSLETSKAVDFLLKKKINIDGVIFDPPRGGLNRYIVNQISKQQNLSKVVYVSCDPSTLSRDISQFLEKGFSLKKIYLVDMFPQTYHIETVTVLERN